MKKEYFENQLNDIFRRECNLISERGSLIDKYIRESEIYSKFKVGDKVMVYMNNNPRPAFVDGFKIDNFSNDVLLKLVYCTASGKPSKNPLLYVPEAGDRIEKIG